MHLAPDGAGEDCITHAVERIEVYGTTLSMDEVVVVVCEDLRRRSLASEIAKIGRAKAGSQLQSARQEGRKQYHTTRGNTTQCSNLCVPPKTKQTSLFDL